MSQNRSQSPRWWPKPKLRLLLFHLVEFILKIFWPIPGGAEGADQQIHRSALFRTVLADSGEEEEPTGVGVLHQVHGDSEEAQICCVGGGDWQWKDNTG